MPSDFRSGSILELGESFLGLSRIREIVPSSPTQCIDIPLQVAVVWQSLGKNKADGWKDGRKEGMNECGAKLL